MTAPLITRCVSLGCRPAACFALLPAALSLLAVGPAAAQSDRLGTITFPTSGAPAAQPAFLRGVLYLHSFEYDSAARAFRAAQLTDPTFAMAYWGEALTHTHGIWNQQDLPAARAILNRLGPTPVARAARTPTLREKAWLAAVEALYGEGGKERRDTLYAEAMARVGTDFPDDEARTLYSVALMGLNQGVRDVPTYVKAGAIALDVLGRNPDHPGAAHYVIHAFDDPVHAPIGLNAARAYSLIAPGAAHAQHMTTHIFLALGMWPEVISQNVIASGRDRSRWQSGHYTYWLHYGLLQAGRTAEAVTLLDELHAHAGPTASVARHTALAQARAHQVINAQRWDDPAVAWDLGQLGWPGAEAGHRLMQGLRALRAGDRAAAAAHLAAIRALPGVINPEPGPAELPGLMADALEAAAWRADGRQADAEAQLRKTATRFAALPSEFGPPDFVKPPHELLGEWLLEDGRYADARRAFTESLAMMPGRLLSVRGLEQARGR
jgi:tetratricopeptide (TPR) repeat protein